MRHRKPTRYRGQHRAPALAPRTRYGIVVSTALVGAGVLAFGTATAMPSPGPGSAESALQVRAQDIGQTTKQKGSVDAALRPESVARAAQSNNRAPAPAPALLPEWVIPADGYISSGFGPRGGEFHGGLDLAGPIGTPIRAASAGTVTLASMNGGYGNLVIIDHGNGVVTYYGHNSRLLVTPGQRVEAGEQIAEMGSTGQSTGSHCHFEVRINDERVDPTPFLREHGVDI